MVYRKSFVFLLREIFKLTIKYKMLANKKKYSIEQFAKRTFYFHSRLYKCIIIFLLMLYSKIWQTNVWLTPPSFPAPLSILIWHISNVWNIVWYMFHVITMYNFIFMRKEKIIINVYHNECPRSAPFYSPSSSFLVFILFCMFFSHVTITVRTVQSSIVSSVPHRQAFLPRQ